MGAYPTTAPNCKSNRPGPQSYDARLAQSVRLCERKPGEPDVKHRGRARRHKQEIRVRSGWAFLRPLLAGQAVSIDDRSVTLPGLRAALVAVRQRMGTSAPSPFALEELIRAAMATGPGRGWGMRNPIPESEARARWTPWYIPAREESQARAWLRGVRLLKRVCARIVALALGSARRGRSSGEARNSGVSVASALELPPTTPHSSTRTTDSGVQAADKVETSGGWQVVAARVAAQMLRSSTTAM